MSNILIDVYIGIDNQYEPLKVSEINFVNDSNLVDLLFFEFCCPIKDLAWSLFLLNTLFPYVLVNGLSIVEDIHTSFGVDDIYNNMIYFLENIKNI